MNDRSHDIDVLNGLVETTLDSSEGYNEAAEQSKNPMITELFRRWASERRRVVADLRAAVQVAGGEAKDDGTALASAHRVFMDLRAHMSKTDKAVVEEVERGEDHIKHKFEDALKDEKVGPQARSVIQAAYTSIKAGHDEMRDLKKSYEKA
jgi:uncharacterized protein (TIGR02284 family)